MAKRKALRKKEPFDHPMVVVKWLDSCEPADNSEIEPHEIPGPQILYQCGFLIKDTEEYISIAGAIKTHESGETYDYVISIPKFAIKYLRKL